jgi:hypothetical protein
MTADATGRTANESPVASLAMTVLGIEWRCAAAERADINPRVWIGQGQLQFIVASLIIVAKADIALTKYPFRCRR